LTRNDVNVYPPPLPAQPLPVCHPELAKDLMPLTDFMGREEWVDLASPRAAEGGQLKRFRCAKVARSAGLPRRGSRPTCVQIS